MHVSSPSGSGEAGSEWGHKLRRIAPIAGGMGQATVVEMCE